jgi:hypothetical protein
MGFTSDILAGRAAVELYLNKSLLTKGLKTVSAEFRAFGAGLSSLGKTFLALGAGITAPLVAAAHSWASSGAELARMSQRTGIAVESLSALKFAAEETDVEFDAVESGVKRMQRAIIEAAKGGGKGPQFLRGLVGMNADEQLAAIADKLQGVTNPAEKAAVAMEIFGRGGTAILPLLSKGAAGLAAFRKEAESLGLIRTKEEAEAALQLSLAWIAVTRALTAMKNALGAAIGPLLSKFLTGMQKNILAARDWIKLNQPLVTTVFKIGVAATAAGAALYGLGKIISIAGALFGTAAKAIMLAGHSITLLLMPLKLAGHLLGSMLSGALSIVTGAFSAVAGLVGGAVGGVLWGLKAVLGVASGAWGLFTGAISACNTVLHAFWKLGDLVIDTVAGIVSALSGVGSMLALLGPLGVLATILVTVAGGLSLFGSAMNGVETAAISATGAVKKGFAAAADAAKKAYAATAGAVTAAAPIVQRSLRSWGDSLKDFAASVGSVTVRVFSKLWGDVKAGFGHLVVDVGGSWDTLQALLSGAQFGEAFKLGLAIMKVEWIRFKEWLLDSWQALKPGFDSAVSGVAAGIGTAAATLANVFAGLKIMWGDVFDAALSGLRKFLDILDSAIGTLREWGANVQAATGNDPAAAKAEAERLRSQIAANRAAGKKGSTNLGDLMSFSRSVYATNGELEERAREQEAIYKANRWTMTAGAPLSSMLPRGRSDQQKKAEDEAARAAAASVGTQAAGIAKSIGEAIKSGTLLPGANKGELADAQKELAAAQKHAAGVTADLAAKQKKARDKLLPAGGLGDLGLKMSQDSTPSRGTFSAAAAGGLGYGVNVLVEETRKVVKNTGDVAEGLDGLGMLLKLG